MAKITDKLKKLAAEICNPGEEILCGLRVNLKGTAVGTGFSAMGGLLGIFASGKVMKKGQEQAASMGIPFKQSMALGITNKKMLVWGRSALTGSPKELLGEIAFDTITNVEFKKGTLSDKLTLTLKDDKVLELESVKVDKGEDFANKLKELMSQVQPAT